MDPVEKFLNTYSSPKTKSIYGSHLNVYFDFLKANRDTYFTDKRDYMDDLNKWLDYNQSKAPMTRSSRMTCIKLFLEDNDIEVSKKLWKQLGRKQKASKPVTLDRIPTNVELKQILEHAKAKERALFLIASSSGMRINEIMSLEEDDIDLKSDPVKIYVRGSTAKFGKARICFMSNEAKNSLIEWLKVRDKFLKGAVSKCNRKDKPITHKNPEDKTIFCFTYMTAANIWHRILKDAGLNDKDKTTGYHRLHIHTLRKFYKTRLLNAGMPEGMVRKLLGQEDVLSGSYDRFTEEELKQAYVKGVSSLLIFETGPDLTQTNKEIEQLKDSNKKQQETIDKMKDQIDEMRLERLEQLNGIKKKK